MTNSITSGLVAILRRYVVDDGDTMTKEVGPDAAQKANELWLAASDALRQDRTAAVIVDQFAANPDVYREPVIHQLTMVIQANANLATRLQTLLAQYETAVQAHTPQPSPTHQATLKGKGTLAQGTGATAIGKGGLQISGSQIDGSINTGRIKAGGDVVGRDKVGTALPGDEAMKAELDQLLAALQEALAAVPAAKEEEAEAVRIAAQELMEKATADKPNKPSIKISGDGLKQAAQNLADITPTVVTIAGQIVAAISRFM